MNCKGSGYDLSYATLTSSHMQDMVREAFQDNDWTFKNATEVGTSMGAEELVWDDVSDDTALTSEEMIAMMNGEGVQVDEHGGFVVRSALDKKVVDEGAEGESEKGYSDDSDQGVHDSMVIDLEDEVYNSEDLEHIDPLLLEQSIYYLELLCSYDGYIFTIYKIFWAFFMIFWLKVASRN